MTGGNDVIVTIMNGWDEVHREVITSGSVAHTSPAVVVHGNIVEKVLN
jgi:hypothetical protein